MNRIMIGIAMLVALAQSGANALCRAADDQGNALSPDGAVVAIVRDDGSLRLLRRTAPESALALLEPLDGAHLKVSALSWRPLAAFSPDGKLLAAVRGDEGVAVWSTADGKPLVSLPRDGVVAAMKFSPDGKRLVTIAHEHKGSGMNLVTLWNMPDGTRRAALRRGEQCEFADAAFSRDGRTLCLLLTDRASPAAHLLAWQLDSREATLYALPRASEKSDGGEAPLAAPRAYRFRSWTYDPLEDLGDAPLPADEPPPVRLRIEPGQ
jgi:hypothetical protein